MFEISVDRHPTIGIRRSSRDKRFIRRVIMLYRVSRTGIDACFEMLAHGKIVSGLNILGSLDGNLHDAIRTWKEFLENRSSFALPS